MVADSQRLTPAQARELTDEVRRDVAAVWMKVLDLYEGLAHVALDYGSFREYWEAEFGGSGTRGEQLLRAGRVARELELHQLPAPANDTVARQLVPVLRQEPDKLADVWRRALATYGPQPTGREVRELVAPYHPTQHHSNNSRGATRRLRNQVAAPLRYASSGLEDAWDSLEEALESGPSDEQVDRWLEHAEAAYRPLKLIVMRLRDARGRSEPSP